MRNWNKLFAKKGMRKRQQFYDSDEEDESGYEHQSKLEQINAASAPIDDLNYQIEKRLAHIEELQNQLSLTLTPMAAIRPLMRSQRQAEPVPRAKPIRTVSLETGKASIRGTFFK